jgi:hypothetical protein
MRFRESAQLRLLPVVRIRSRLYICVAFVRLSCLCRVREGVRKLAYLSHVVGDDNLIIFPTLFLFYVYFFLSRSPFHIPPFLQITFLVKVKDLPFNPLFPLFPKLWALCDHYCSELLAKNGVTCGEIVFNMIYRYTVPPGVQPPLGSFFLPLMVGGLPCVGTGSQASRECVHFFL